MASKKKSGSKNSYWFRLHNDLLNDPVVQQLTPEQYKVYINTLCFASHLNKRGEVGEIESVSFALRETISNVSKCFTVFQGSGLIVSSGTNETGNETFHIPQWDKKQYKSDTSTDRVRKYRDKKKRSKTVTETAPDTDTDTDTDKIIKPLAQNSFAGDGSVKIDQLFDRFWSAGMHKIDKKKSRVVFSKLIQKTNSPESFVKKLIADIEKRIDSGQRGFMKMNPVRYLRDERWNDESTIPKNVHPIVPSLAQSLNDNSWADGFELAPAREEKIIN